MPNAAVRISAHEAINSSVSRDDPDIVVILDLILVLVALATAQPGGATEKAAVTWRG